MADAMMRFVRHATLASLAVQACFVVAPGRAQPRPPSSIMTCANTTSGTTWDIDIDYGNATVDDNPASISDSEISWRDRKDQWNYTLDRKSGKLTSVVASSTGGYMQFYRCRVP